MRIFIVLLLTCLVMTVAHAAEASLAVPRFLHYQSLLTDGGGNPRASGPATLQFHITDANHNLLFAEAHEVTIINGMATALLGNGTDPKTGAVSGGIPPAIFRPETAPLLEVWLDGELADDRVEIVSAPYAFWSDTALHVVDQSINSAALAPGAVTITHFADGLMDELAEELTTNAVYQANLADPSGAESLGVNTTFIYSASKNVQGVLQDLDQAIKAREEKNVNKDGDTMVGKLTIANGGLDVTGNITGTIPALNQHTSAKTAHGASGAIVGLDTLNSGLASKLSLTGGTMFGNLSMNGLRLTQLGDPTDPLDATRKSYVDGKLNDLKQNIASDNAETLVHKTGDTMSGNLTMGGNLIKELSNPLDPQDAVTLGYVNQELKNADIKNGANIAAAKNEAVADSVGTALGKIKIYADKTANKFQPDFEYFPMPSDLPTSQCHWTYGFAGGPDGDVSIAVDVNPSLKKVGFKCSVATDNPPPNTQSCIVSFMIICLAK